MSRDSRWPDGGSGYLDPTQLEGPIGQPFDLDQLEEASQRLLGQEDRRITIVTLLCTKGQPARHNNWMTVYKHLSPVVEVNPLVDWIVVEQYSDSAANLPNVQRIAPDGDAALNRSQFRNVGWKSSDSPMICFLDSDCVMSQASWERSFEECWNWDCYSPYTNGAKLGRVRTETLRPAIEQGDWSFPIPKMERWNLCGGLCFIRRSVLEETRGWDERFHGHGYQDIALGYLMTNGGYRYKLGNEPCLHLWHPRTGRPRDNMANHRRLKSLYLGKTNDEIIQKRAQLGV